jgi:hypothetical protein
VPISPQKVLRRTFREATSRGSAAREPVFDPTVADMPDSTGPSANGPDSRLLPMNPAAPVTKGRKRFSSESVAGNHNVRKSQFASMQHDFLHRICALIGAGGGGSLMFYSNDETRFRFDFEGTKLVVS